MCCSIEKKIVFITARLPYPANSGRKNVMYNYCKILHDTYGYSITIISFLEKGDVVEPKPYFIDQVVVLESISGKRKLINLIRDTLFLRKYPMQVSLFYNKKNHNLISSILQNEKPDVVICDMVRTTEYARLYKGYKIADLDDMLSIRYKRQMETDMSIINPYGAYLFSLPRLIQKILLVKDIKKIILKSEIELLQKYERDIAQVYDKTIFVAQKEADILNQELQFNRALSVPLGVDIDYFGQYFKKIETQKYTIGFLGAMSVAHNESGVIHFIDNILPHVIKKIPNVRFIIVGGGVTEKVRKRASKNIIFTGYVEDVREAIGICEVFVCPLTFGSGIKTKNLEAMAMGIPIVTTTIGAENIHAVDGYDWLVENDCELFAEKIIELMINEDMRDKMRNNAKKFVEENFSWKVAEERFKFIEI